MGAGQIGGIASLLDIDFQNAAGFVGRSAELMEAQYVVYFLSHSMMFCAGALIEPHIVITPASCVHGERFKFEVFGGTHKFMEMLGAPRSVVHMAVHRGYNGTERGKDCSTDNIALLLLNKAYSFSEREEGTEFLLSRVRYGHYVLPENAINKDIECHFYGWGSRRNGYLIPLLINLRRVDTIIRKTEDCLPMWNYKDKFLCLNHFPCRTEKYGALCPDDLGSVLVCHSFLRGMMVSRLIDRPCGVGFLDLNKYMKFMTCGVDDARDVIGHDDYMEFATTFKMPRTPDVTKVDIDNITMEIDAADAEGEVEDTIHVSQKTVDEGDLSRLRHKG